MTRHWKCSRQEPNKGLGITSRLVLLSTVSFTLCLIFSGCGKRDLGPRAPVKGKITVAGEPLTTGQVVFILMPPDPQNEKFERVQSLADIQEDGSYEMRPEDGVVLGRHKVTVFINKKLVPSNKAPFASKYSKRKESDLIVEVTRNPQPGAYDLNLEKNLHKDESLPDSNE